MRTAQECTTQLDCAHDCPQVRLLPTNRSVTPGDWPAVYVRCSDCGIKRNLTTLVRPDFTDEQAQLEAEIESYPEPGMEVHEDTTPWPWRLAESDPWPGQYSPVKSHETEASLPELPDGLSSKNHLLRLELAVQAGAVKHERAYLLKTDGQLRGLDRKTRNTLAQQRWRARKALRDWMQGPAGYSRLASNGLMPRFWRSVALMTAIAKIKGERLRVRQIRTWREVMLDLLDESPGHFDQILTEPEPTTPFDEMVRVATEMHQAFRNLGAMLQLSDYPWRGLNELPKILSRLASRSPSEGENHE